MSKIIFTVSELNLASQRLLEDHFSSIWVEGEISNLVRPSSGHFYFTLKDPKAQIRCALFRAQSKSFEGELRNGLLVQLQAKVSIYADRGDYQLIVERVELAGDGLLKQAFDALVTKLTKEGLFEEKWKKQIPLLPNKIGVITSPTGAAIQDIVSVLKRRFPSIPIIIYPTKVQGSEAMQEIVKALDLANRLNQVDVLILARGGGSLEDLWPFNEESVAKAIYKSTIPIVTGVGHEIDFTIADFVADRRAATPSAAAELVAPHQNALLQQLSSFEARFIKDIRAYLQRQTQRLDWLLKQLRDPSEQIKMQLDRLEKSEARLKATMLQVLKDKSLVLQNTLRTLEAVSPLATLNRGYSIVSLKETGVVIRSIHQVQPGDNLEIKVQDGTFLVSPIRG